MANDSLAPVTGVNIVIEGADDVATGAQAVEPHALGRTQTELSQYIPRAAIVDHDLQRRVEAFLFTQSARLDAKDWQGYIECFNANGVYWMPAELGQTDWELEPSIFAEDILMMEIRMGRLRHPNAWSQAPLWGTNHIIGNVIIEAVSADVIEVYSRFQMMELRRDTVRHFGGTYRHTLVEHDASFRIDLQRVDMMNGQAAYDYVLQAWV
jgi:3-phenylpropionate/cinnamic acid dioxygenase small subunit